MVSLKDKSVVVVGGARGIGAAIAVCLAKHGAKVWVLDTDQTTNSVNHYQSKSIFGYKEAQNLCIKLNKEGFSAKALPVDATSESEVIQAFTEIQSGSEELYGVVNTLGITTVCNAVESKIHDFNAILQTNLIAPYITSREAAKILIMQGKGGAILNISSIAGKLAFPGISAYCASKAGLQGFSASLALELAKHNIRVNCVCPGIVKTNMWDYLETKLIEPGESNNAFWDRMLELIPLKQTQNSEQIASFCVSILTNTDITAQSLSIDGGMNGYI